MPSYMESPWARFILILIVASLVYGYVKESNASDILKCAMQNGYESRPSGKFMSDDVVWVRVICKHCGGKDFNRSATESVKLK